MTSLIQNIAKTANALFSKSAKDESFREGFLRLKDMLHRLRAHDISLGQDVLQRRSSLPPLFNPPVTYMDLFENENIIIGVFIVHSGQEIPLHDHPSMFGLIKVLAGRMSVTSYTPLDVDTGVRLPAGVKPCVLHADVVLGCEDEPCILEPSQGNIHRIKSLNGTAAFLDILAPPYNDNRDCHYYMTYEITTGLDRRIFCLKEIKSPPSFWCDSQPYIGPAINID